MSNRMCFALALAVLFRSACAGAADEVVAVGAGGYLTVRPPTLKPLPGTLYKSASFKGPMVTNQWWSSLVWKKYSQPLFAHPLVVTCGETGLAVGTHGTTVKGAKAIMGSGPGKEGDFILGHSAAGTLPAAICDGFSDWFVTIACESGEASMKASIGHGSPFVYALFKGGNPVLTFKAAPAVWSGSAKDPVLGITVNGRHYGLFGATGSTWSGLESPKVIHDAKGKEYFSVAALPDNKPETLAHFKKYAYSHVMDTRVEFVIAKGTVESTYQFTTQAYEGNQTGTLFALYPHQWKYSVTPLLDYTYGSVRGLMKVGEGAAFKTTVPIQGLLPMLPGEGIADRSRMAAYLREEAAKKPAQFGDTYWEGKLLGRLATLSGIAEVCGEPELQKGFVDEIKRRMQNWFTASPEKAKAPERGKIHPVFYYNNTWGTLIGSPSSYGSDDHLNDHHFHYGYFIRAAAEVARLDAEWAKKWGPMVEVVIRDIASTDRQDPLFPFLRCFDKYAGHSWASGDADFADGNNQESSSESLNAWYGMLLWGQATGNMKIRDTGLFLFNTERTAVEEYWFDVGGTNFPKDFQNVALGMVWGGKGDFATWFSADIDCIHGINWLPFTPASVYMGRHPDYVKKNYDSIVSRRKGGMDFNNGWGDLVVMFSALHDTEAGAKYIDANPKCKLEGGNSYAFMYHWSHTLAKLGRLEPSVTSDHPFVNVYSKNGVKTYAAYNYSDTPLEVSFSDGMKFSAPKGLTVQKAK